MDGISTHRIHVWYIYIYMLTFGVYWWYMLPYIYIAYMDPMGYEIVFSKDHLKNRLRPSGCRFEAVTPAAVWHDYGYPAID